MRGLTIEQILFLLVFLFLPMIEAVLRRRRGPTPRSEERGEEEMEGRGEEEGTGEWVEERVGENDEYTRRGEPREGEISFEGVSAEGRSYDDAVERRPMPAPVPAPPPVPPPAPTRLPESVIVRAPAPVRTKPVYAVRSRMPSRGPTPLPAAPAARRKQRRIASITASEARRGIVLMEVLGPCVSLRDADARERRF